MRTAVFTICAKNYLAQATTLRESALKHNPDTDFYLFLSDMKDTDEIPDYVLALDDTWIPSWRKMAFKYNVIEFSTSIKPFCIAKLFNEGYDKVIYLDPDIYVTRSLSPIYKMLDEKSVVLSPHYCNIQTDYTGAVSEEELLWVGIYNLGFGAFRNNNIGNEIVEWWCNRLEHKCYADHKDGLHVDQKWMDFIPCFFPNDVEITHHPGINPAIWNLHERELLLSDNGEYLIKDLGTGEVFPLLFFHFSGFDPFRKEVLNRRHPKYGVDNFPSFKPLIDEYVEAEYRNGYDVYSKLTYSFNSFENGENIMPLHRRIYRSIEKEIEDDNPFAVTSKIYGLLDESKLLSGIKSAGFKVFTAEESGKKGRFISLLKVALRVLKRIVGIRYYVAFLNNMNDLIRYEEQVFIIGNKRKND